MSRKSSSAALDTAAVVGAVAEWIRANPGDARKAPVPGASVEERRSLAALGGLAAALVPAELYPNLPASLHTWLSTPRPPDEIVARVRPRSTQLESVLAEIYNQLLPPTGRRVLGTFFTPSAVVDDMVRLASALSDSAPAVVVDPGAGVGAFTGAAARRWRHAQIHAVDINVVTLGLLAARASQLTPAAARRLTLHHADYLSWVRSRRSGEEGGTLTIGNPPYTRHQLLTARQKDDGMAAAGALLKDRNSTLAGYMVAATLGRLRPADSAVLLLPSNWLRANYARLLREWLWKRASRSVEIKVLTEQEVFADANVSASVLAVGPVRRKGARLVVKIGGDRRSISASQRRASAPNDWYALARSEVETDGDLSAVCLGDVVRVRRGAATGSNRFFVIDRALADRLDSQWVVRAAGRLHALDDDFLDEQSHDRLSKTGANCWMLRLPPDADVAGIQWYIDEGNEAGVANTFLAQQRTPWWSIEQLAAPRLLVQPMTKKRFRVVTNDVGAFHTNTLYGLYPLGLRGSAVDSIAEWLRSDDGQAALARCARPLSSGLMRVEPRALSDLRLPRAVAALLTGAAPTDEVKRSS